MIKFFRKIRQKLLSENQFSKYLIYAIGEIVLVVIGILIAISINNRNELSKSRSSTLNNLREVKYDLLQEIGFFQNEISRSDQIIKYLNHIKAKQFDSVDVENTFDLISTSLISPDLSRSYNKLNQSGFIDIIGDSTLINALHDYYLDDQNIYTKYTNYNSTFVADNIEGYLIKKLEIDENLKCSKVSVIKELNNGRLVNLINYQCYIYQSNKWFAERMIRKAENLILLIEKEVN